MPQVHFELALTSVLRSPSLFVFSILLHLHCFYPDYTEISVIHFDGHLNALFLPQESDRPQPLLHG